MFSKILKKSYFFGHQHTYDFVNVCILHKILCYRYHEKREIVLFSNSLRSNANNFISNITSGEKKHKYFQ